VIINDLLDISRIESGRGFSLNKEPLDLAGMVESKVDAYRQLARDHSFSTHVSLNSAVVWADRDKLDQVLENLFSNAVKYSPAGGIITVRASAQPEKARICISISDQGIGMTPEETAQVFDKFYRADAGNTAIGGTGLGMSIVKYIMQAHEGDVWLESEPGQGTRVHLALPMRQHANSEEEGS
jgi:signal transduction histidine kinase